MPVTTRSQKRKLDEFENEAKSSLPSVEYIMPPCEYMPDFPYHDLKNDKELQAQLYGKYFEYDFTNWPESCKFISKEYCGSFATFIQRLQLKQLMSWGYRMANTTHQIDMTFKVTGFLPTILRNAYIVFDIQGLQSGFYVSNIVELERKLHNILKEVQVGACTMPDEGGVTDYYFTTDVCQVEIRFSKNHHDTPYLGPVLCYC